MDLKFPIILFLSKPTPLSSIDIKIWSLFDEISIEIFFLKSGFFSTFC